MTTESVMELKMELAKVGLCMVHGMSQKAQADTKKRIDDYVERIKTLRNSDQDSRSLERAVSRLFEKNSTEDPVRLAGIAMHMCDRVVASATRSVAPSRLIRDASRYSECAELKEFLKVVADEVDRVNTPAITKQVEESVDILVDLYDEDLDDDDCLRRRTIETIHTLLPKIRSLEVTIE